MASMDWWTIVALCSVAASDSAAQLLGCIGGLLGGLGTVTFVSVGVPGVCSVAGLCSSAALLALFGAAVRCDYA